MHTLEEGLEKTIKWYENNVIGSSFFIPTNEKEMNDFLNSKISERELFQKVKKYRNYNNCRFIYF